MPIWEMALKACDFECISDMVALNASGSKRLTEEK